MRTHITRHEYVCAFNTWLHVAAFHEEMYVEAAQLVKMASTSLLIAGPGGDEPVPIANLCGEMQAYFTQWAAAGTEEERKLTRTLIITIGNSNLLHRIIYQGEKLRVHPCPVCEGSWSGLHCDAGLCGGCGWLPNPPWLENKPDLDGTKVYVVTVSDDGEGVRDSCASIHGTEGAGKAAEKEERKGSWDEVKLFEWTVGVIGSEKRVT